MIIATVIMQVQTLELANQTGLRVICRGALFNWTPSRMISRPQKTISHNFPALITDMQAQGHVHDPLPRLHLINVANYRNKKKFCTCWLGLTYLLISYCNRHIHSFHYFLNTLEELMLSCVTKLQ